MDLNDLLQQQGGDGVRKAIDNAAPYVPQAQRKTTPEDIYVDTPRAAAAKQRSMKGDLRQPAPQPDDFEFPEPDDISSLNDPPAPTFPAEWLPAAARVWAEESAISLQAPVEMIAVPMIAILAGCIGSDAAIELNRKGWQERCAMYGAVFAPKGSIKSPALKAATFPLAIIEGENRKEWEAKNAAWKEQADEAKLRLKAWESRVRTVLKKHGDDADMPEKPDGIPPAPVWARRVTSSATIEKLAVLMSQSPGMTLVLDELSALLVNMERYSGGSDRQFYLAAYSGEAYSVDRIGRQHLHIPCTWLTIIGGIQPVVARKLLDPRTSMDDGLIERLGCSAYPARMQDWKLIEGEFNAQARAAYLAVCRRLAQAQWSQLLQAPRFENMPPICRLSELAQALFDDWLTRHMPELAALAGNSMEGFMSKGRGFLGRLTLILHLAKWAGGEIEDGDIGWIENDTMTAAIRLVDQFFIPTWRRIVALTSKTTKASGAMRIAAFIRENPDLKGQVITARTIRRKQWSGLTEHEDVVAAMQALLDHGWLVERVNKHETRGGRASLAYIVNPKVFP